MLTLVITLEEVNDIVEASDHVLSVVVLPPEAGDNQSSETDDEDINDNLDDAFELAGQLPLIPLICLAASIQQPGRHAVSTVERSCHGPGCCRFLVKMVGPGF